MAGSGQPIAHSCGGDTLSAAVQRAANDKSKDKYNLAMRMLDFPNSATPNSLDPQAWTGTPAPLKFLFTLNNSMLGRFILGPAIMVARFWSDDLRRLAEAEGRDPSALTISFKAPIYDAERASVGASGSNRRPFSGPADRIMEDIAVYAKLGVSELIFDFRSEHLSESRDRMERFAAEIMARSGAAR
jgi:hypothetical protein